MQRPWHPARARPPVLKGTTTVGLRLRNHVVLGADRRATAGYYVAHKHVKKIVKLTDYMAMTTAGLVADAQVLAEWVRTRARLYEMETRKRMPVSVAANLLASILLTSRRQYFMPYFVQLILGGYDTAPRLYSLDLYGTITEERYIATGSGSVTAIGLIEDEYDENMPVEKAVDIVRRAILSSIRRDAFTGNGIDVVVIGPKGIIEKSFEVKAKF